MKEFEEFRSIILTLSKSEKRQLLHRLRSKSETYSDDIISTQIVEMLSSERDLDEKAIQRVIYGKLNPGAFRKVLSRNFEKVFDVLIFCEEIEKSLKDDSRARDIFLLERSLLISEILRFRGLFDLSSKYLDRVINEAKAYEHYSVVVNALEKKLKYVSGGIEVSRYRELESEINYYMKCKLSLNYVLRIYSKFVLRSNSDSKRDFNNHSTTLIKRIDEICLQTKSNTIKLYRDYLYLQYLAINDDFYEGFKVAKSLLDFTLHNKSIYSRQRVAFVYFNLSLFARNLFNHELSLVYLDKANKYSIDNPKNDVIFYENSFLTQLQFSETLKSKYYLSLLMQNTENRSLFESIKHLYFQLAQNFIEGKNNEVLKCYNSIKIKLESKFEVSFYIRIIVILAQIEMNEFDIADKSIDSLRKILEKTGNDSINLRFKHIGKLLSLLKNCSYDFRKVQKAKAYLIDSIIEGEFSWKPNSPELIIFEEWFMAKIKGVSYNHKTAVENVKKRRKAMMV